MYTCLFIYLTPYALAHMVREKCLFIVSLIIRISRDGLFQLSTDKDFEAYGSIGDMVPDISITFSKL